MKKIFGNIFLIFVGIFCGACLTFSGNFNINNVWKIPDTKLDLMVSTSNQGNEEINRQMILSENYSEKKKISLSRGSKNFARLNVYQTSENQYVLKDVYKTYLLDVNQKTLQESSLPPNPSKKFIGAFDYNENGGWRYIPESECKKIPLAGVSEK